HWTNLEAQIASATGTISKSVSVEYPLPTLGARGSWRIGENWRLSGFGQILKLKVGDYDGEILNYGVGLEWAYARNMLGGLGYDYYKSNAVSPKERPRAEFDFRSDGPKLYFGFSF